MVSHSCLPHKLLLSRSDAVEKARAWIGTPYVLGGRVRGGGCDCATLLAEYLVEIGASERENLGVYSHDWFCHTTNERYLAGLMRHARKTMETICRGTPIAKPGTLALFRCVNTRVFNHGAIVTEWPRGIHAVHPQVEHVNLLSHHLTSHKEMALFDPWSEA